MADFFFFLLSLKKQVSLGVLEATILGDQFSWLKTIRIIFDNNRF